MKVYVYGTNQVCTYIIIIKSSPSPSHADYKNACICDQLRALLHMPTHRPRCTSAIVPGSLIPLNHSALEIQHRILTDVKQHTDKDKDIP